MLAKGKHGGDQCKKACLQVKQRRVTRVVDEQHTTGSCMDANIPSLSMYLSVSFLERCRAIRRTLLKTIESA